MTDVPGIPEPGTDEPAARRELADTVRRLAALGLSPGGSGNASVRLDDRILITPTGGAFARTTPESLAVVRLDGEAEGDADAPKPSKEVPLHLAAYRERPDIRAVVHLHSPHATALAVLAAPGTEALEPHTPYAVMRLGGLPVAPYARPGSAELGDSILGLLRGTDVALLGAHGSIAVGATLAAAADLAEEAESAAQVALLLRGADAPVLPADEVAALRARRPGGAR